MFCFIIVVERQVVKAGSSVKRQNVKCRTSRETTATLDVRRSTLRRETCLG